MSVHRFVFMKSYETEPMISATMSDNDDRDDELVESAGSDSGFDDEDGDELFDMFTGEASRAGPQQTSSSPIDREPSTQWQWVSLRDANEIRLIEVEPSNSPNDVVRGRMKTTSLEDACEYYTLSYAWGTSHDDGSHLTQVIDCDDAAFRVTQNLHDALLSIRALWSMSKTLCHLERRPIWCDAICIDQNNAVERSRQVMMMDRIYKRSAHLLIWLGDEVARPVDMLASMVQDLTPADDRNALVEYVVGSSHWFRRRWVIQESASQPSTSSSLLSSNGLLSVQTMRMWIESSDLHQSHEAGPLRERDPAPLILNLHWHRHARCSDDRDRVYALRSVSLDGSELIVDYTKTTDDLYTAVALLCVRRGLVVPLLILAVCNRGGVRYDAEFSGLASWIPDWRHNHNDGDYDPGIDPEAFYPALDLLDKWADQPALSNLGTASGCRLFQASTDAGNMWRLQLTGWLFHPCTCETSVFAEDCLHCLVSRFTTVVDQTWLQAIRDETLLMLQCSEILTVLEPREDDVYQLKSVTKLPEGQNLAGRIGKHWITESGAIREMQDIVLV